MAIPVSYTKHDIQLTLTAPERQLFLVVGIPSRRKAIHPKNRYIVDQTPLQVYCAGLIFASQAAIIRTHFQEELPTWICQLPKVEKRWGALIQILEGHSGWIPSMAFSPDGRLLASGSHDETVRLWDPVTGMLILTLEGHSDSVNSVAFSPDGRLLALGSFDNTVRLWDLVTGALVHKLKGHSSGVISVIFSPRGRLLASGSRDETVRLWDPATGALIHTLEADSSGVYSLVFSSDGLQSADFDETVRLWNPMTGALIRTLEAKESVSEPRFYHDRHLCSVLDIDCRCSTPTFYASPASLSIGVDDEWITLNDERVLWLPVEFRHYCFAVNGSVLALGHKSGRVSFLRFRI